MKSLLLSSLLSLLGLSGPPAVDLSQISLHDQVQRRQGLHQILRNLTEDPDSRLAYLGPDLTDHIAEHIILPWTLDQNSPRLLDAAILAAQRNQEPNHLLEVLALESLLLRRFLQSQEVQCTDSAQWKDHATATLATFYGLRVSAANIARIAADDANHKAFEMRETHKMYHRWMMHPWVRHVPERIRERISQQMLHDMQHASWYLARHAATTDATDACQELTFDTFCDPETAAYEAVRRSPQATTASRVALTAAYTRLLQPPHIWAATMRERMMTLGRMSYRIAETQTWLTLLQHGPQLLAKAYQAARTHLQKHPPEHHWFESAEGFHRHIDQYLVEEVDNPRARQLLQPLVDELHRIGSHIFPDYSPSDATEPAASS
ncbi:MAG: hypothetical protein OXT67_07410 [Zetaproteobacteria bacterium]|nr:hypothetical protein [Zetaproteobacteria bacterium]